MSIVQNLGKVENFSQLKEEVLSTFKQHSNGENQIMLQTLDGVENWVTGTGKVKELEVKNEREYVHIQPSLKGTMIEHYIKQFGAYRSRIMSIPPKKCYSVHSDISKRIHLPIVASTQAWMVFPHDQYCTVLAEGTIYLTNTIKHHTYFNGGDFDRIHLVLCVDKSFKPV